MSTNEGNGQSLGAGSDTGLVLWMRLGFRLIASVGLVQTMLGLSLVIANPTIDRFDDAFLFVVFGGSSIMLFRRQPQFAAIFALIPSGYAESILHNFNWAAVPASVLIPAVLWLLLLQHPVALPREYHPLVLATVAIAILAGAAFALANDGGPLAGAKTQVGLIHYGIMVAGAAILCQRCFSEGLLKSPRTIIFALSLAPISLGMIAYFVLGVAALPLYIVAPMNCGLAIAPLGTLLFELAHRRKHPINNQLRMQLHDHSKE